jgi:predicted PhzF superfamily epimerase YddE/YHI9
MAELIAGLIDVFADAPLTGNPLAVVQNADGLVHSKSRGPSFKKSAGMFCLSR